MAHRNHKSYPGISPALPGKNFWGSSRCSIRLLGWVYSVMDRHNLWGDGLELLKDTVEKSPGKYRQVYNLATTFLRRHHDVKHVKMAIELFKKIERHAKDDYKFYNNMGTALKRLHYHKEAIGYFKKSLRYKPLHEKALYNLVSVYAEMTGIKQKIYPDLMMLMANKKKMQNPILKSERNI